MSYSGQTHTWHRNPVARLGIPVALLVLASYAGWPRQREQAASPILQELHHFRALGSVLYVAAHPDDENTELITYLARGRGYRTAYLSLTRGDGGQNLLGPDFGDRLGVARTQELLAARRLDGGQQFFTRARDFGFSKDYRETFNVWDRQQVLSDVVRVIRTFQPDVIITRFSPQPGGTHGHHTASAVLALEAFRMAGDARAFPEQLTGLKPWQPTRILHNTGTFGGRGASTTTPDLTIDVGGNDVVLGESFASIAARSRAMHITQGFGQPGTGLGPPRASDRAQRESFLLLAGDPANQDIMDGIDVTWNRVPGGAAIAILTDSIISQFNTGNPAASVPALLRLRSLATALPAGAVPADKRRQLDHILIGALGLQVQTSTDVAEVVPGEEIRLQHTASVRAAVPVRWLTVRYPSISQESNEPITLQAGRTATRNTMQTLPATTPLTQPYWLRDEGTPGMFRVTDAVLIGRPENPAAFPIEHSFEIDGQSLVVADHVQTNESAERRRSLDIIAPVSLGFPADVTLFAPRATRNVQVVAAGMRDGINGWLQLEAPAGWSISPARHAFQLGAGDSTRVTFAVTAPVQASNAHITATATVNGARYQTQRVVINYDHIPRQLLQPRAQSKAVSLNLAIRGQKVGYLAGAGDDLPRAIEQMGYAVTQLTESDLTPARLKELDAVVTGVRAFNVRNGIEAQLPALFQYVEEGGNLIVQYNVASGLQASTLAPFPLRLSSGRITDENAPPTFLAPDHAVLNSPNRITAADFQGWVQERGLYFPGEWDARFTPIVAFNDPDEAPLQGGLLVASHGRGHFVYTGLAFFRQLPAGVPGAYRLFANLLSLGH